MNLSDVTCLSVRFGRAAMMLVRQTPRGARCASVNSASRPGANVCKPLGLHESDRILATIFPLATPALTVNASGVTKFLGAVGAGQALRSLSTDAAGETDVNGGSVRTTGDQTYGDKVVLTGTILSAHAGSARGAGTGGWSPSLAGTGFVICIKDGAVEPAPAP